MTGRPDQTLSNGYTYNQSLTFEHRRCKIELEIGDTTTEGANGYVLLYNLDSRSSFEFAARQGTQCTNPRAPTLLLGKQSRFPREVGFQDGKTKAQRHGWLFKEWDISDGLGPYVAVMKTFVGQLQKSSGRGGENDSESRRRSFSSQPRSFSRLRRTLRSFQDMRKDRAS